MTIDISEITFTTVNDVVNSWEMLKATPNYDAVVSETLFRKIIELIFFEKNDPTVESSLDSSDQSMANPLFKLKSTMFVKMLDVVINMLGPDLVPIAITLQELGAKHYDYGVSPEDYDVVGTALFFTLEKYMGNKWNKRMEKSWRTIYKFISEAMVKGTEIEALERKKGISKRMSIPPRKSKLNMGKDTIANSMKEKRAGLMGLLDKAITVTERGA
jgi:hemoglobin-like flavoprotein